MKRDYLSNIFRRYAISSFRAFAVLPAAILLLACRTEAGKDTPVQSKDSYALLRERMVVSQIESRGIRDSRVLAALRKVPRHQFVPENERSASYDDTPLPIGRGQTISQPYIVALMSELMDLDGSEKVLEIGTGSGYQAAILAELAAEVYTIEIVPDLARRAENTLNGMGYRNIHIRCGNGYMGWPEAAPFDAVMVTAAPEHIPQALVTQLRTGGRLVVPVGSVHQELLLGIKSEKGLITQNIIPVRFVPMTGEDD